MLLKLKQLTVANEKKSSAGFNLHELVVLRKHLNRIRNYRDYNSEGKD